jgi:hypothetical protein
LWKILLFTKKLEKAIKELKKKGELALPFLVFLYEDQATPL